MHKSCNVISTLVITYFHILFTHTLYANAVGKLSCRENSHRLRDTGQPPRWVQRHRGAEPVHAGVPEGAQRDDREGSYSPAGLQSRQVVGAVDCSAPECMLLVASLPKPDLTHNTFLLHGTHMSLYCWKEKYR